MRRSNSVNVARLAQDQQDSALGTVSVDSALRSLTVAIGSSLWEKLASALVVRRAAYLLLSHRSLPVGLDNY